MFHPRLDSVGQSSPFKLKCSSGYLGQSMMQLLAEQKLRSSIGTMKTRVVTAIQATEQRRHFVHWSGMRPSGPLLWSQHLGAWSMATTPDYILWDGGSGQISCKIFQQVHCFAAHDPACISKANLWRCDAEFCDTHTQTHLLGNTELGFISDSITFHPSCKA